MKLAGRLFAVMGMLGAFLGGPRETDSAALPQSAGNVFQQGAGPDFLVVAEAENYGVNAPSATHTWNPVTTPAGFVGTGAMMTLPDTGANIQAGYSTGSPRLDFVVNFVTTGTHYVWVRGRSSANASGQATGDSCHAGLDGAEVPSASAIASFPTGSYVWHNNSNNGAGPDATLNITSVGIHTVNLWMREDGFIADRILLTTTNAYFADGNPATGPPESQQVPDPRPGVPANLTATPGVQSAMLSWNAVSNATSYTVLRSTTAGGPYSLVAGGVTGTTYTDPGLDWTTTYFYVVQAVNNLGTSGNSNEASVMPLPPPPRTNDHDEGLYGDRCACGTTIMPTRQGLPPPLVTLAAVVALTWMAGFRRSP